MIELTYEIKSLISFLFWGGDVLQALKYSSKSHPSSGDHRHEKMRDAADPSPPNKMLRRSDSPENKYSDSTGHSKAKNVNIHRVRDLCFTLLCISFPSWP